MGQDNPSVLTQSRETEWRGSNTRFEKPRKEDIVGAGRALLVGGTHAGTPVGSTGTPMYCVIGTLEVQVLTTQPRKHFPRMVDQTVGTLGE